MRKFNIGVFADNDFVYRVDGYTYTVESINDIDFDACIIEAKKMFPQYSGILITELETQE
jgi:hypothetical protein